MDPHPIPTTQWRRTVRRTHAHTHTHTHEQTTSIPERAPETAAAQTLVNRGGEERKTRRVQPSAYEGRYLERQTPVKEDEGLRARESPRRFIYRYCCAPPFLPAAHHPPPAANPPPLDSSFQCNTSLLQPSTGDALHQSSCALRSSTCPGALAPHSNGA